MNIRPDEVIIFFGFIFLIVLSPGPSNLLCAASGAQFGVARSIPFIAGMNVMVFIPSMLVGMGVGELLLRHRSATVIIEYLGAAVVLYMAYKFFRSGTLEMTALSQSGPTFWEGVFVQLFNAKGLAALVLIYSQLIVRGLWSIGVVFFVSLYITIMSVGCHLLWLYGGERLTRRMTSARALRIQGYVFGALLVVIALWMVIS